MIEAPAHVHDAPMMLGFHIIPVLHDDMKIFAGIAALERGRQLFELSHHAQRRDQ
jgi:hypothetical protein